MTDWTPPADPNLQDLLSGARADTGQGLYARALAKYLWLHHNALRISVCFAGVRLSFALSDWLELAAVYPPARAALVRTRDETEAAFAARPTSSRLFQDLAALNRHLGDGLRTADAFARTARTDPVTAGRLYHVAEPYLLAAGRYDACGPFLDPPRRLADAARSYNTLNAIEEARPGDEPRPPKLARRFYVTDAATLVALLVLDRRPDEAAWVRDEALTVLDDADFRALLDAALTGHLPPPLLEAGS